VSNYDITENWNNLNVWEKIRIINGASKDQLDQWASDPKCNQRVICAELKTKEEEVDIADFPFDPRTEVSADARHIAERIIKHLWIIFAALSVVLVVVVKIW